MDLGGHYDLSHIFELVFFYKLLSLVTFLNGGENTTKVWRSFILLGLIWADRMVFFRGLVGWGRLDNILFLFFTSYLYLALRYIWFNRSLRDTVLFIISFLWSFSVVVSFPASGRLRCFGLRLEAEAKEVYMGRTGWSYRLWDLFCGSV